MDGKNNGKPYEQMDDLGVPLFLETLAYFVLGTAVHLQPKVGDVVAIHGILVGISGESQVTDTDLLGCLRDLLFSQEK